MGTSFERANKAIEALVSSAMEKYHVELHKEGVTIDCVIARAVKDETDVHALKLSGYPIDAKIGVTSLQDRVRGIADAKLTIDGFEWDRATDRQRLALIDHELEHLDLVQQKPTEKEPWLTGVKRDDLGRPKLKVRPHDWVLAGFKTVAERHGQHSHEALQFARFRGDFGQLNLFGPSAIQVAAIADPIDRVAQKLHDSIADAGGGSISSTINGKTRKVTIPASKKSKACRNRHHASCKSDGCLCECHQGEAANA